MLIGVRVHMVVVGQVVIVAVIHLVVHPLFTALALDQTGSQQGGRGRRNELLAPHYRIDVEVVVLLVERVLRLLLRQLILQQLQRVLCVQSQVVAVAGVVQERLDQIYLCTVGSITQAAKYTSIRKIWLELLSVCLGWYSLINNKHSH